MANDSDLRFRCEACGYDLRGLPVTENCPECGRPIRSSLPQSHPGSPWQQRPDAIGLLRTILHVAARPRSTRERLRIGAENKGLKIWSVLLAGGLVMMCIEGPLLIKAVLDQNPALIEDSPAAIGLGALATVVIGIEAMVIEMLVSFVLALRGCRRRREVSQACGAHAAAIWPAVFTFAVTANALLALLSARPLSLIDDRELYPVLILIVVAAACTATLWHTAWLMQAVPRLRHRNHPAAVKK